MNDKTTLNHRYDVIIVGAGSAGAVVASRISEDRDRTVLLLEAGPDYPDGDFPPDLLAGSKASVEPFRTWGYAGVPDTNGHAIAAWAGKVIGGGSAINGAISRRARPTDFARWTSRGLPEWGWDQVLETFRELENTSHGEERWHGRAGRWPVRQGTMSDLTEAVRAFVEAAFAAGYPEVTDFNDPGHLGGAGAEATNIVYGIRHNTAMAYLGRDERARPNLTIVADVLVDKVRFEGSRAVAVCLADGREFKGGEIIVSAGTFGTAGVLLRSGIGPAAHLDALGIGIVADLPVGLNLQDQPMFVMAFPLKPNPAVTSFTGSGVLWIGSTEAGDSELDQQLSISVQPGFDPQGHPMHVLSIWSCLVTPRATGIVRLKDPDPRITPFIDFRLLTEESDQKRLRELVALASGIASDKRVTSLLLVDPGETGRLSDQQLDAQIARGLTTFLHATSTAPMGGADDPHSVVDAWGRVRGVSGLRVVDASIFPTSISVPINLTVIMVAERIAAKIRDQDPLAA